MSKEKRFWSNMEIEFELPYQAVVDCHHQGDCEVDCRFWQDTLQLGLDRDAMIRELTEYCIEGCETFSNEKLEMYCIWLASGNIQETKEFQDYEKQLENEEKTND